MVEEGWVTPAIDGVRRGAGVGGCGLRFQHTSENREKNKKLFCTFHVTSTTTWDYHGITMGLFLWLHLSDWVVRLSWGWQPFSSSPLRQWGIPSQRSSTWMQPPGGGHENWPGGQLRGLVVGVDCCTPAKIRHSRNIFSCYEWLTNDMKQMRMEKLMFHYKWWNSHEQNTSFSHHFTKIKNTSKFQGLYLRMFS